MRLKESTPAKQDRGHGTRQFPNDSGSACTLSVRPWRAQAASPTGSERPAFTASHARQILLGLFLVLFALAWVRLFVPPLANWFGQWPDALLLIAATATTLSSLTRELPAQNVVFVGVLLGLAGLGLETLNAATGLPFGKLVSSSDADPLLFHRVPWGIPLLWLVMLLNARGVARVLLVPRRANPNYGLYVLGLTVILVVAFDLSFQPFVFRLAHYWNWPAELRVEGLEISWRALVSRGLAALIIMTFVTPILLNKKPCPQPSSPLPLVLWSLMLLLFLTAAAVNRLWLASAITLAHVSTIAAVAWQVRRHRASLAETTNRGPGY